MFPFALLLDPWQVRTTNPKFEVLNVTQNYKENPKVSVQSEVPVRLT